MTRRTDANLVPALEIGGSHVTAAMAHLGEGRIQSRVRRDVDPDASSTEIIATWANAARALNVDSPIWGVAIPGPFDYERGIGDFAGVAKFAALSGVDVGTALSSSIGCDVTVRFINDADAFAVGEWIAQPPPRPARLVGITLGTGVGTGFVDRGRAVSMGTDVPPGGDAYRLSIDGRPLEETASTRAILAAYRRAADGEPILNIKQLTDRARAGDAVARTTFQHAWAAGAQALAPYLDAFGSSVVVTGGSIARSWDLVEPALRAGLRAYDQTWSDRIVLRPSADTEAAALLGAAHNAQFADSSATSHQDES